MDSEEDLVIDLLILESDVADPRRESVRLRATLRGLGRPLDVIVMSTDRFEETKHLVGSISYPANKYGRVVYEAASLTPFGVEYRYPGEYPPVSGEEAAQSIAIARNAIRSVAARLDTDAQSL